jgi:O-succinylbenzoate synthase
MEISAVDVHLLDLPLVEPFAASHGTTRARTVVALRLTTGDGTVGWGECSALPAATYTGESAAGCHRLLADRIGPRLVGASWSVSTMAPLRTGFATNPMALSAVEMALLDAELRASGRSLARWLGAERSEVPAGVSLGLDRPEAVVATARRLVIEGYRRLKVKIQPGHDRAVLAALRDDPTITGADVEIHLDANGAYPVGDLELVAGLAEAGADAIEQPFAPDDVDGAARLVERLADLPDRAGRPRGRPVPVVADEAVTTIGDAATLADRGAITGVSIKPGRVGGLEAAVGIHDLCRDRGLAATAGGMLETGLGRHALAALAALPGFDLTGDLSPARRWLAADPWPDLTMTDGTIAVPTGPGVAPAPDPDLLERHTVERRRLEVGR